MTQIPNPKPQILTRHLPIVVGTRGSQLALIQTQIAVEAMRRYAPTLQVDIRVIKTEGDRNRTDSLTTLGGRGVFVRDIEERLLEGEIDFAVHSLKDLPTKQPDGLYIAAMMERADARDVLISHNNLSLDDLPHGAKVGSSSRRRAAQLLALRPDLQLLDMRGNVDTRLRKLDEGQYDAIVLAAAGLVRLSLAHRITQYFSPDELLPAVGQGALVVECRADDMHTLELLAPLDHAPTRAAVTAERSFLSALGGGCQLPIAAFAEIKQAQLHMRGLVAQPNGQRIVRAEILGETSQAESLGDQLAERMQQHGVLALMEAMDSRRSRPLEGKRVVVTRAREQAEDLSEKLRALGATPIEWPMIEIAPPADFAPLDEAIRRLSDYAWLVFSSANGVQSFWGRLTDCQMRFPRIAAVGEKTAEALRRNGLRVDAIPEEFLASNIVSALGDVHGQKILLLRPDLAPPDLATALRERGAQVDEVIAYRTLPMRHEQPLALDEVDAIIFASASAAKNFAAQLSGQAISQRISIACIGPSTANAAREAGMRVDVEAQTHTLDGLVAALVEYFNLEVTA